MSPPDAEVPRGGEGAVQAALDVTGPEPIDDPLPKEGIVGAPGADHGSFELNIEGMAVELYGDVLELIPKPPLVPAPTGPGAGPKPSIDGSKSKGPNLAKELLLAESSLERK